MKNFAFILITLALLSCGGKQPKKTPKQIKAEKIAAFKQKAVDGIESYLKRNVSSDPDYARILEVSDTTLNDSLYSGYMRVAVKNVFGAVQQLDGYLFCVCRKDSSYYIGLWEGHVDFIGKYKISKSMKGENIEWADVPDKPTYDYVVEHGTLIK